MCSIYMNLYEIIPNVIQSILYLTHIEYKSYYTERLQWMTCFCINRVVKQNTVLPTYKWNTYIIKQFLNGPVLCVSKSVRYLSRFFMQNLPIRILRKCKKDKTGILFVLKHQKALHRYLVYIVTLSSCEPSTTLAYWPWATSMEIT